MIIRELSDGTILKVLGFKDEEQFMLVNNTGQFSIVKSLPPSASQQWKRINGEIVSNKNADDLIDKEMYKAERAAEYPSIPDQLDLIYHEGVEAWKSVITSIKEKYPKDN